MLVEIIFLELNNHKNAILCHLLPITRIETVWKDSNKTVIFHYQFKEMKIKSTYSFIHQKVISEKILAFVLGHGFYRR